MSRRIVPNTHKSKEEIDWECALMSCCMGIFMYVVVVTIGVAISVILDVIKGTP